MNSRIKTLVLLFCLFTLSAVQAAPVKLAEGEGLKGNFIQFRHLAGFEKPIRSEGEYFVLPGVGLIWQTLTPVSTRMEIDGESVTQTMDGVEVTRIGLRQFPALKVLKAALENSLAGNWEYLETLSGEELDKSAEKWTLHYSPETDDGKIAFRQVRFEIGDFLDKVEILKEEGDRDVILFSNQVIVPGDDLRAQFKAGNGTK